VMLLNWLPNVVTFTAEIKGTFWPTWMVAGWRSRARMEGRESNCALPAWAIARKVAWKSVPRTVYNPAPGGFGAKLPICCPTAFRLVGEKTEPNGETPNALATAAVTGSPPFG